MSVSLPNGALIAIANGYAAPDTVSAVSNANPAVATATAHGISNGTAIEITSGWSRLDGKIVRAANTTTNTLEYEGIDTTSTTNYPAGSGTGSVRAITGWTQLGQVLSTASNGGEQQFTEFQFLESDAQKRIPTVKSAEGLTITIADDPTLAGFILASTANDDRLPRAVRVTLPNGSIIFYNAYITLRKTPTLTVNEIMSCELTLSFVGSTTRYAS